MIPSNLKSKNVLDGAVQVDEGKWELNCKEKRRTGSHRRDKYS